VKALRVSVAGSSTSADSGSSSEYKIEGLCVYVCVFAHTCTSDKVLGRVEKGFAQSGMLRE